MNENEYAISILDRYLAKTPHKVKIFSEVPRGSHSDHADAVVIDTKRKVLTMLEFKIGNREAHARQVLATQKRTGIKTIGINPKSNGKGYFSDGILCLPGEDIELETAHTIHYIAALSTSIYSSHFAMMYYYAYMERETDYRNVGTPGGGERETMYQIFVSAVSNASIFYGHELPFDAAYSMFPRWCNHGNLRKYWKWGIERYRKRKQKSLFEGETK